MGESEFKSVEELYPGVVKDDRGVLRFADRPGTQAPGQPGSGHTKRDPGPGLIATVLDVPIQRKKWFRPFDVCRIAGISYRQIQYWDTSGFFKPAVKRRGRYRLYSRTETQLIVILRELRISGVSIQSMRAHTVDTLKRYAGLEVFNIETATLVVDMPTGQVIAYGHMVLGEIVTTNKDLIVLELGEIFERVKLDG